MLKLSRLATLLAMAGILVSCAKETTNANYNTIPLPQEITASPGGGEFTLDSSTKIIYPDGNEMMRRNAGYLAGYLKTATGTDYATAPGADDKAAGNIQLRLGLKAEKPEAYNITVSPEGFVITGASEAGVFYGLQTLRKSIPIVPNSVPVLAA
ncbi:MAG: glycoside hydrolase family 20 zincin-like fold domain-containing protein, partial [Duncaniella sp.]|nr:glycoside hydrolase family 20 zincin-like fold domain-containing protein [Duncaniella sp.]